MMHINSKQKNCYLDSLSRSLNFLIFTRATLIIFAASLVRGSTATTTSSFRQSALPESLSEIIEPRRHTRAFPYSVIPSFRPVITELDSGSLSSPAARVYYIPPQKAALRQRPHRFIHVDKAIPFGHPNAEPNEEIVDLLNTLNSDRTDHEDMEPDEVMEMARQPRVRRNVNSIHLPLKRYACRFKFCRIYDV